MSLIRTQEPQAHGVTEYSQVPAMTDSLCICLPISMPLGGVGGPGLSGKVFLLQIRSVESQDKQNHKIFILLCLSILLSRMFPRITHVVHVSEFYSFLRLNRIPFYAHTTFCLSVLMLMDIWVVFLTWISITMSAPLYNYNLITVT